MVRTIGANLAMGRPLTLKLLFLEGIGSVATVQRRLSRLIRLGIVIQTRDTQDRRNLQLSISPKVCEIYKQLGRLMRKVWGRNENRRKAQHAKRSTARGSPARPAAFRS